MIEAKVNYSAMEKEIQSSQECCQKSGKCSSCTDPLVVAASINPQLQNQGTGSGEEIDYSTVDWEEQESEMEALDCIFPEELVVR